MKKVIAILVVAIIIVSGFLITSLPYGTSEYYLEGSGVTMSLPANSKLVSDCCMHVATFKSLRSTYSLKQEFKKLLARDFRKLECSREDYYYNRDIDVTLTNYTIKNKIGYNEFVIEYQKGNYCGNHSFTGVVIEVYNGSVVVRPDEGTEIRTSSDKVSVTTSLKLEVGDDVIVYYTGTILESYPVQIETISIEKYNELNFEIDIKNASNQTTKELVPGLYTYGIDEIMITIGGNKYQILSAMDENLVTIDTLIKKVEREGTARSYMDDGGTSYIAGKTITILECHRLMGNNNIYIMPSGTLNTALCDL